MLVNPLDFPETPVTIYDIGPPWEGEVRRVPDHWVPLGYAYRIHPSYTAQLVAANRKAFGCTVPNCFVCSGAMKERRPLDAG